MKNKDNVIIRPAKKEDMESVQKIYAPYVLKTAITFEYEVPSVAEFENRYHAIMQKYPFLVSCVNNEIVGYAYAGSFIGRRMIGRQNFPSILKMICIERALAKNCMQNWKKFCVCKMCRFAMPALRIPMMKAILISIIPALNFIKKCPMQ